MREDNELNMDFLKNLPEYKSPDRIWERLEVSLFSVDTNSLPEYAPSLALWNRIEKNNPKHISYRKIIAMTAFILLISTPLIFFLTRNEPTVTKSEAFHHSENRNVSQETDLLFLDPVPISAVMTDNDQETYHIRSRNQQFTSIEQHIARQDALEMMPCIPSKVLSNQKDPEFVQLPDDDCSPFTSRTQIWYGMVYEYEHFLSGDSYLDSYAGGRHSLGFLTRFEFSRFNIESGLNLAATADKTNWIYDYLRHELINTYEYIDSAYYDPATGQTFYYTSLVDIYDSIPYSESMIQKRQAYLLRVPFMLGTDLYSKKKLTLGINGGVIYNIMIGEHTSEISYEQPNSEITNLYYRSTFFTKHTINLAVNVSLELRLNRSARFFVRPSVNYYLTPLYQQSNGKLPVSVGIGTGILL